MNLNARKPKDILPGFMSSNQSGDLVRVNYWHECFINLLWYDEHQ